MDTAVEKTVLVFVVSNNNILLLKRHNTWFENMKYLPPGGLVDPSETPEEAAVRELSEETDIFVEVCDLTLIKEPQITKSNNRSFQNYYFSVNTSSGTAKNLEPHRHTEVGWYDINNLPKDTSIIVLDTLKYITAHEQPR